MKTTSKEHPQNGVRRVTISDPSAGARRTLCALMMLGALAALGWLPAEAQLASCPTSDIQSTTSSCYELTPAASGADPLGENANDVSLILTPSSAVTPRGVLLLYLNGTMAHPDELIASPTQNFY